MNHYVSGSLRKPLVTSTHLNIGKTTVKREGGGGLYHPPLGLNELMRVEKDLANLGIIKIRSAVLSIRIKKYQFLSYYHKHKQFYSIISIKSYCRIIIM